jgi:hypothetical protein
MKNRKTKLQTPEKFQISNSNTMTQQRLLGLGAWDFFWSLVFGIWCFDPPSIVNGKSE